MMILPSVFDPEHVPIDVVHRNAELSALLLVLDEWNSQVDVREHADSSGADRDEDREAREAGRQRDEPDW